MMKIIGFFIFFASFSLTQAGQSDWPEEDFFVPGEFVSYSNSGEKFLLDEDNIQKLLGSFPADLPKKEQAKPNTPPTQQLENPPSPLPEIVPAPSIEFTFPEELSTPAQPTSKSTQEKNRRRVSKTPYERIDPPAERTKPAPANPRRNRQQPPFPDTSLFKPVESRDVTTDGRAVRCHWYQLQEPAVSPSPQPTHPSIAFMNHFRPGDLPPSPNPLSFQDLYLYFMSYYQSFPQGDPFAFGIPYPQGVAVPMIPGWMPQYMTMPQQVGNLSFYPLRQAEPQAPQQQPSLPKLPEGPESDQGF